MLEKLDLGALVERYEELGRQLSDPDLLRDQRAYQECARAHANLEPIVQTFQQYQAVQNQIEETRAMLNEPLEPELHQLAEEELKKLHREEEELHQKLRILLLPKDPNDDKNVIVEIRAGAGGEEAALFAADLLRMYTRYAERHRWAVELLSANPTELGGFKEVIFQLSGRGAYSRLKFESGVHRVQRVPVTEASGRIHTSTATVAVLPEADEVEVDIDPGDLRIDVYRSTGHGGQHVNTTDSAVRITHLPTGTVVTCQDERSQQQNREKAMRILRARLLDRAQRAQKEQEDALRRTQVGTGDRSERIRTYNFPQGRVTDHRIGLTLYQLENFLDGDMDELLDALAEEDQARKLSQAEAVH